MNKLSKQTYNKFTVSLPADDFIQSIDLTKDTYWHTVERNRLKPGTRYYFTVTATNNVGLTTSKSSDGILVDTDKPMVGVIFNTQRHTNVRFQSSTTTLSASWHGFDDHQSFIEMYSISLLNSKTGEVVAEKKSVGLSNSVTFDSLNVSHGESYFFEMIAVDSVSHASDISRSENITIDTTGPIGVGCQQFTESNTLDAIGISSTPESHNRTLQELTYNLNLTHGNFYKLEIHAKFDMLATPAILQIGDTVSVSLQFAANDDGTFSSETRFIASEYDQTTLVIKIYTANPILSISRCQQVQLDGNSSIMAQQISKNLLSVSALMVDNESGIRETLIGAGTTKGGYQVLPLTPVTPHGHPVVHSKVPHGSTVYPTLICTNYAGLQKILFGAPITIDHTPPQIAIISSEMATEGFERSFNINESSENTTFGPITDIDNLTTHGNSTFLDMTYPVSTIKVMFDADDTESGLLDCFCAIGKCMQNNVFTF